MKNISCGAALLAILFLIAPGSMSLADDPADVTFRLNVVYRDASPKDCRLDVALPQQPAKSPRPAIVVIHGGGWIEGDKSSFSTPQGGIPGSIRDFARLGFVAATINYRLAGVAPYPAGLDDCRCAVRWMRAHAKELGVDPRRIGAFGNSAGGHLALLVAAAREVVPMNEPWAKESSGLQAVVSDSGPIDLVAQHQQGTLRTVVERFMGGPPNSQLRDRYRLASPSALVDANLPPLLLIYGGKDNQVPVATADSFVTALERAGCKDVSYLRLAEADHCPYSIQRVGWVKTAVDQFFIRTLRDAKPN